MTARSDFLVAHLEDRSAAAARPSSEPSERTTTTPSLVGPFYSIPEALLQALECRLPNALKAYEFELEREFTKQCRHCLGVFCGQYIQHGLLDRPAGPQITEETVRRLGWDRFGTTEKFQKAFNAGLREAEPVTDQLEAYSGWLITNPIFLRERDELRSRWGPAVEDLGAIPSFPQRLNAHIKRVQDAHFGFEAMAQEFQGFCRRWQLLSLTTWDLPRPLGVNLGGPAFLSGLQGLDDSPAVQLSPTLDLPRRFPLRSYLQQPLPDNLADWRAVLRQRHPSKLRIHRWGRVFHLQFLRNIVLKQAYADRFSRQEEALDWVFADYLGDGSHESVRKLRLIINRRLGTEPASQKP